MLLQCSEPEISPAVVTSRKLTPAAAADTDTDAAPAAAAGGGGGDAAVCRRERLVQLAVSRHGALVAVYNTCDSSSVFKVADVNDGPADSWKVVVEHQVTQRPLRSDAGVADRAALYRMRLNRRIPPFSERDRI